LIAGAPHRMKMSATASPWRYDAALNITLLPTNAHAISRRHYDRRRFRCD
jgi:hypothetical protein